MTADSLFRLCNSTAMAGWLLLIVTGWSVRLACNLLADYRSVGAVAAG